MSKKKVIIIGSGPSALMSADVLSEKFDVSIYEKENAIARKLILASKGGFNISNNIDLEELKKKYTPEGFFDECLDNFTPNDLRKWFKQFDATSFVGSSGKIFIDKHVSITELIKKIKAKLEKNNVKFFLNYTFVDFNSDGEFTFESNNKIEIVKPDYCLFALGGASWINSKSAENWRKVFEKNNIKTQPFQPSNCGVNINWPENIIENQQGKPLKNISITVNNKTLKGEAVITKYGLEGYALYPLIPEIRDNKGEYICIDFKPFNSSKELLEKIKTDKPNSNYYSKTLNINSSQLALIKSFTTKEAFLNPKEFVKNLKGLKIPVESLRPIEESISTVGGVDLSELNKDFSLKKYPNIFILGEMINWDAPTGGYLLQGCFSVGRIVGERLIG